MQNNGDEKREPSIIARSGGFFSGSIFADITAQIKLEYQNVLASFSRLKNLGNANYETGVLHLSRGNVADAILRFRVCLYFQPQNYMAHYNLALCYINQGNTAKAITELQKTLAINPGFDEAKFMLAVTGGTRIDSLPASVVTDHFNKAAATYNQDYLERLKYDSHIKLAEMLKPYLSTVESEGGSGEMAVAILDLGAGTGLAAKALCSLMNGWKIKKSVAVDLSSEMLKLAELEVQPNQAGGKLYSESVQQDITSYLRKLSESKQPEFDIVIASLAFNYIGELSEITRLVSGVLSKGGILAFNIEKLSAEDDVHGFAMHKGQGRFGHSLNYIKNLAEKNGMDCQISKEIDLVANVPGYNIVMQRR
jgi:predicted TPR repeat methyltransferase